MADCPKGSAKLCQNVFRFSVNKAQSGISDTYPALISTIFETADMNWCAGAYTHEIS